MHNAASHGCFLYFIRLTVSSPDHQLFTLDSVTKNRAVLRNAYISSCGCSQPRLIKPVPYLKPLYLDLFQFLIWWNENYSVVRSVNVKLKIPCVLACYNKNNLFFSKADCLLLERVQQWLKKYVMCNEHWWVFWSVSFAFRKSWKRCFVNCTKWRMKSSMVRLICSWNTHEG